MTAKLTSAGSIGGSPTEARSPGGKREGPRSRSDRREGRNGAAGELPAEAPLECVPRPSLRQLPAAVVPLDDPLLGMESRLAGLERAGASPAERAETWHDIGRQWQLRYGSIEESARAYREAAAVDPTDVRLLQRAATASLSAGDSGLGRAYARAALKASSTPRDTAHAQRLMAWVAAASGDEKRRVEALCASLETSPGDPHRHELAAYLLARRGDISAAVEHARAAASMCREHDPVHALQLLTWAFVLRAGDAELAQEYADGLVELGKPHVALAVLAEAARHQDAAEARRQLTLGAAQLAEELHRADIAAELLLEAYDADPDLEIFHAPLLQHLENCGRSADAAVIAEEIARRSHGPEQAQAWLEAARRRRRLPMGHAATVRMCLRALQADPRCDAALALLRADARSERDRHALADALETAAEGHRSLRPARATELFRELAVLAEDELHAWSRALRAWEQVVSLSGQEPGEAPGHVQRLAEKVRLQRDLIEPTERELEQADTSRRPAIARTLGGLLRDRPDEQARVAELYWEWLAAHPEDAHAWDLLQWLLERRDARDELVELLEERRRHAGGRREASQALGALIDVHLQRDDPRAVADASRALLALDPQQREAVAYLARVGMALDDPELEQEALQRRAELAGTTRERGRALACLARSLAHAGDLEAAVAKADAALVADAESADAAWLVLRHAHRLAPHRAVQVLDAAHELLGDSSPVLGALARAAHTAGRPELHAQMIERAHQLAPRDPDALLGRLRARMEGRDAAAVDEAARGLLDIEVFAADVLPAIRAATLRLAELGSPERSARLALLACARVGRPDPSLVEHALQQAARVGDALLIAASYERQVALRQGEARLEPLTELARVHQQRGDAAAEARAWQRVLDVDPRHAVALDRLVDIYAGAGDSERLLAVLSARLDAATDATQRTERWLDLATAATHVAADPRRARTYLEAALSETATRNDRDGMLAVLGALFELAGSRSGGQAALSFAARCEKGMATRICAWVAATAEDRLADLDVALRAAELGLRRTPGHTGLMLCFERIALSKGAVDDARRTFGFLVDTALGMHGRRALLYRAGRWMERAGEPREALDWYARAFATAPRSGAILHNIERLARETGAMEPLVSACLAWSKEARDLNLRVDRLQRAALLCNEHLDDPGRAFDLHLEAWELSHAPSVERDARLAAEALSRRDAPAGETALAQLERALQEAQAASSSTADAEP